MKEKKPLPVYPTSIPKRYNHYGEWKPLVYLGDFNQLEIDTQKIVTDRTSRIFSCVRFMLATNTKVIELIVKSNFSLPYPDSGVDHEFGHFHMRKIDVVNIENNTASNLQIYDCSMEVKEITAEAVDSALDFINIFLYRLAYSVDARYDWFLKYPGTDSGGGLRVLTVEEMDMAKEYLFKFNHKDSQKLDKVISWYQAGNRFSLSNPLLGYLSYYLALENLALEIYDGNLEISAEYKFKKLSKKERREEKIKGLLSDSMRDLYSKDVVDFVRTGYTNHFLGNHRKTKEVLCKIFGVENITYLDFITKISTESESYSLYDLRNNIAHGNFSPIEEELDFLIQKAIPVIKKISRTLISKVLWRDDTPKIKRSSQISLMMNDPRSSGISNDLHILDMDWRIKLEWLF